MLLFRKAAYMVIDNLACGMARSAPQSYNFFLIFIPLLSCVALEEAPCVSPSCCPDPALQCDADEAM